MSAPDIDLLPMLSEMRARQLRGENVFASKQRESVSETQAERYARDRNEIRRLSAAIRSSKVTR